MMAVSRLADSSRIPITAQLLETYADHLEGYDAETLGKVFWDAEEYYKFMPSISELMDDADDVVKIAKRNSK